MDFKKLIPDFGAFGRTNWGKPVINTKDKNWLISAALVVLMLVFVFLPWTSISNDGVSISRLGITTWYGVIGLISVAIAAYGVLYEQKQFVFCASVLAIVMGLIGTLCIADVSTTINGKTITVTAESVKKAKEVGSSISVGHIGAILFMVASAVSAVWSFLQIKNEK
jgi:hypothetical protein